MALFTRIFEYFDMPIEIIDTTQLTMPGYVGANIIEPLFRYTENEHPNLCVLCIEIRLVLLYYKVDCIYSAQGSNGRGRCRGFVLEKADEKQYGRRKENGTEYGT